MKRINSRILIAQLQSDVREIILKADQLQHLGHTQIQQKPGEKKWSVIEVIDHLNFYCRYYITEIEKALATNDTAATAEFKSGWLGNYFTKIMKPKEGNSIPNKMSAPKNALPSANINVTESLNEFISHQHHLINLIQIADACNLNSIRISTNLHKWITLKLGDTFQFLIAHEQRHFIQISNVILSLQNTRVVN